MFKKHKLNGYATFSDRIVYDEDIYQYVRKHSRLVDRLNGRKMIEMAIMAFDILNGSLIAPNRRGWKFYDRKGMADLKVSPSGKGGVKDGKSKGV